MGSLWGEFGVRIEGPRLQAAIFCYLASHYSTLCLSFPSCKLGVQTVTNLTGLSLGSVEQLEDGWSFTGTVLHLSLSVTSGTWWHWVECTQLSSPTPRISPIATSPGRGCPWGFVPGLCPTPLISEACWGRAAQKDLSEATTEHTEDITTCLSPC